MRSERRPSRRSDAELLHAIIALANECRAPVIAAEARRSMVTSTQRSLQLCSLLRHHLFELQCAISRTRPQRSARLKAIEIARSVAEQQLDRVLQYPDAVRTRITTRLAIARTKFVMATKADAMIELSLRTKHAPPRRWWPVVDMQAHEVANAHLAGFWMRTVSEVHAPVTAFATALVTDLDASLVDLGEALPRDALVGVTAPPLGTFGDEMGTRVAPSRADLGTLLETGADAIVQRLVDYYDHAICATDARFRERLDGLLMAALNATSFADAAQRAGDAGIAEARRRIADWSSTLNGLIDDLG